MPSRQYLWQLKKRAERCCPRCGDKLTDTEKGTYCDFCKDRRNTSQTNRKEKKG